MAQSAASRLAGRSRRLRPRASGDPAPRSARPRRAPARWV